MTEQEWLSSEYPAAMLSCLGEIEKRPDFVSRMPSYRKLRLFAVACCRSVWPLLTDERSREAVEVAERFADGEATAYELYTARLEATRPPGDEYNAATAAWECCSVASLDAATHVAEFDGLPAPKAALLRDIVGNPFRPVVLPGQEKCWVCDGGTIIECTAKEGDGRTRGGRPVKSCPRCEGRGHSLCPWLTPTVLRLAHAAYEERLDTGRLDPGVLAVLSDALEEAGCPQEVPCPSCVSNIYPGRVTIDGWQWGPCERCLGKIKTPHPLLAALRADEPRYRGFWAIDLLTGRG